MEWVVGWEISWQGREDVRSSAAVKGWSSGPLDVREQAALPSYPFITLSFNILSPPGPVWGCELAACLPRAPTMYNKYHHTPTAFPPTRDVPKQVHVVVVETRDLRPTLITLFSQGLPSTPATT